MTKKLTLMVPDELIDTIETNKDKLGSLVDMLKQSIKEQIAISDKIQETFKRVGLTLAQDKSNDE